MLHRTETLAGRPWYEDQQGNKLEDDVIESVVTDFISQHISVPKQKASAPFILAPVGLVGSGKSTIIEGLMQFVPLVRVRTDDIRDYLKANGFNNARTHEIAVHIAIEYVLQGHAIALDADCVTPNTRQAIMEVEQQYNTPSVWVHIVTPEEVVLERLRDDANVRRFRGQEAIDCYFDRKELHKRLNIPFNITINGAGDATQEVERLYEYVKKRIG